jgi:excisionase family DNA binding protein
MEKLLGIYEVAKVFNVDYGTAWRWVKTGRVHGFKTPGNHWRVKESIIRSRLEAVGATLPKEQGEQG